MGYHSFDCQRRCFLARACVDDLVALKWVRRKPLAEEMQQSDATLAEHITRIMPSEHTADWQTLKSPLLAYQRVAQGPKIKSLSMYSLLLVKVFRNGLWIHCMRDCMC